MARLYLYNHTVFVQIHISINMNKNVGLRQRFDSTLHVFYRFKKLKKFNIKWELLLHYYFYIYFLVSNFLQAKQRYNSHKNREGSRT